MLTKPDQAVIRNLARLGQSEFKPLMDFLKETELQAVFKTLASAERANVLAQMQGRAQFITELVELVNKAPDLIQ